MVYEVNGPFFFGVADKFIETFNTIDRDTHIIILRLRHVPVLDATGLRAFMTFIEVCKKKHTLVLVTGLNKQPEAVIRKAGLYDEIGSGNFFFEFDEAIKYARSIIDVLNSGHKKHKQIKS